MGVDGREFSGAQGSALAGDGRRSDLGPIVLALSSPRQGAIVAARARQALMRITVALFVCAREDPVSLGQRDCIAPPSSLHLGTLGQGAFMKLLARDDGRTISASCIDHKAV